MKRFYQLILGLVGLVLLGSTAPVYAESSGAQIFPVSNVITLEAGKTSEYTLKVTNPSKTEVTSYQIYTSPYSYTYLPDQDEYVLGFSTENNYTQITRWISFKDTSGNFVPNLTVSIKPEETREITYRIAAPASIPNGGQYAVIFAQTINDYSENEGIKTNTRAGLIVYGHAVGETIKTANIIESKINKSFLTDGNISANGKVQNTGNIDISVVSTLKIDNIFGINHYKHEKTTSVIPETTAKINDEWPDTAFFGIFKATWTIEAGDKTEEKTAVILVMPIAVMIVMGILLTIIIIWIIILIRKHSEQKSRAKTNSESSER